VRNFSLILVFALLLLAACAFALQGGGNYEYEVQSGQQDSLDILQADSLTVVNEDSTVDDEFDLLD